MEQQQKDHDPYKFEMPTRLGAGATSFAGGGLAIGMSLKDSLSQHSMADP